MLVNLITGLWHLLLIVVEPLVIIAFLAGLAIWLFCYMIPPNTLGIPVFLGGKRMEHVMEEGLNFYFPFCKIITHSLSPRERMDFDFMVNVLDDGIHCRGKIGFHLLRPNEMKEKMKELGIEKVGQGKNYLILYNEKQDKIEADALAHLKEGLDKFLSRVPAECALTKELKNSVQICIIKGAEYKKHGTEHTAQEKIEKLVVSFKDSYVKTLKDRGAAPNEIPEIEIPEKFVLKNKDADLRGLEKVFLEDYGVLLSLHTLMLEPSEKTKVMRTKLRTREIEREIKRLDTEFVISMTKKVKEKFPELLDEDVQRLVMVIQGYYEKPTTKYLDVTIKGLGDSFSEILTKLGMQTEKLKKE